MHPLETDRLNLRPLTLDDARFILALVNEPAWLQFIGDKGVRTEEQARGYLENGPLAMYRQHGLGPLAVELKATGEPIGICGLLKRETLADVDLGFAYFPRHWGRGYAQEAARAVLAQAHAAHGLTRVVALTAPANGNSIRLIERLGFSYEKMIRLTPAGPESKLFARLMSAG